MRIPGGIRAAAIAVATLVFWATPAAAHHDRAVPPGLTNTLTSTHFAIHYGGSTTQEYAQAGLADLEEAYSRLVTGGGGTPNAGLEAPTDDGDGKIDLYISPPDHSPSFSGGLTDDDSSGGGHPNGSAYMFITPDQPRAAFRFRAAHELMHVIQYGYSDGLSSLTESTANWAAEFALPDAEPLDSFWRHPEVPFDCTFFDWEGAPCGNGYNEWLFYQMLVEDLGVDVIHGLLDEERAACPGNCLNAAMRQVINDELADQGSGGGTLRSRYAEYARRVLDPADWASTAPASIFAYNGGPPAHVPVTPAADASGSVTADHLSTRYVRISTFGHFEPSGPDDKVRIQFTRPAASLATATHVLRRFGPAPGLSSMAIVTGGAYDSGFTSADPSQVREFWLPLVNDTETTNDLSFAYTVTWQRGTPTPPPNDERANAQPLELGAQTEANNVYAGGNGSTEAPGCGISQDATRGTWYRFTAPNSGIYNISAAASDFRVGAVVFEGDTRRACLVAGSGGEGVASFVRGRTYDVYVGRHAFAHPDDGTTVRLTVTGPGAPADPPASGGQQTTQTTTTDPPTTQGTTTQPTFTTPSAACQRAQRAYTAAQKSVTKAKRVVKKARGRGAKRRANAKLKKARKKLAAAKRARTRACSG